MNPLLLILLLSATGRPRGDLLDRAEKAVSTLRRIDRLSKLDTSALLNGLDSSGLMRQFGQTNGSALLPGPQGSAVSNDTDFSQDLSDNTPIPPATESGNQNPSIDLQSAMETIKPLLGMLGINQK